MDEAKAARIDPLMPFGELVLLARVVSDLTVDHFPQL
jgi:hypothetical protein